MKAAKALKEKGETPEELLRSIKENEAAVAEAQRVVDAWRAIVGEKSRREEAAKAEAERIAAEKAEAERKAAEERERAEAEKRIAEEKAEAERKAQEERERAEEERDRIEAELDAQKADEEARLEAERKAEEEAVEKDAELKEDKKKPQLKDVVKAIYEKGKSAASRLYKMAFFDVAKTPDFMKKLGLTGDRFTIKYGVLSRHAGKDDSHSLTEKLWEELPDALQKPFAITRFGGKDKGYRLYTTMKNENGETIVVGVDVKNVGRDMEVNAISTIFGRRGDAKKTQKEDVLYTAENITPEQRSLLGQPNSDQYTGVRERNVSTDKGSEKAEKKQEKQSVFDKAKEIADKEEKKRKAEADSVLGQATRAVGKKKKVNLFKYTVSEKNSNSALRGVHYANGYAYASDGYILFKEKADYPKEWEGTTRDKDGNLIDGKYPDTEKAIHRLVRIPDKEVESLPSKEVLDFAIAASKKLKGEAIPVAIDGIFFNAVNLKRFLEAVASKGMDKVVYRHPMLYATNGKDEIVLMPTVNTLEGALDIADRMESAGLPKEQIDAWKAHIEAADKKMSLEDFKKAVENAKKEGVRLTEAESPKRKADERYQRGEGGVKPSKAEVALRDAVIDRLRESGIDVIADEAEGQRVLDEVNGRAKVQMGDAPETFAERQKQAVESHGVVMPGLNESYVEVVKDIPRHEYTGSIAEATREAIDAAKRKYAGKELTYNNYGANFNYTISANAIDICLSPKHQNLSANKGIHLALAEHLDEVINKSVEVEEHPDYIKGKDGKRGEEVNPNAIMHRFYGVAVIDGTPCRVMTLMREDGRSEEANGVHSYEVQKIEVLDNESPSTSNGVGTQMKDLSAYPLAKLLKGVEKSYDKGKYLLDESKKRSVGLREQRVDGADGVRFFRTANGEAYGFTVGGRIYIDPRIATSETPVHEYAHLWAEALRNGNPKEWQNVVELMKGTKVWDEVKARYPELKSDDEIADEVIATYSGRRGAERLREEQRKIAEGNGGVFEKAEAVNALERVKQALKKFWNGVADFLHIHYKSAEEVADRVMKDLLEGVDPRKMGKTKDGGVRFSAKQKRALETASLGNVPRSLTVVSSAAGANVLNNIENLAKEFEKSATQPKTFIGDVAKALGASRFGSGSEYATFETKNGNIVTIRLANHNAHVSGFDHNDKDNGISIVISPKPNEGITNDGNAHITEFYYDSIKLRRAEGKPLAEIVRSIKQALYSGEFKDTTGLAERQEVNGEDVIRYQSSSENSDKTLAGVHNITEEKLRKALKLGGLANPSVAVIDISKNSHEGFGEISLILPSEKVAKRTGKNAGTWQGDAWTPTYPQIERRMSNKGAEKASKDVLSVPSDMYSEVRIGLDRWLDSGEANSAMAYMFLHEKGVAPEPKKIQPKFSDEAYNELKSITAGNFNIYGISKADAQKVLAMYIDAYFDGDKDLYEDKTKAWLEKNRSIVDAGDKGGMRYAIAKENVKLYDEYGFNYRGVQTFVRDVEYDHRNTGVDMNATLNEVEDYIKTNSLTDEFNTWQEGKEKEYGIKEVIFDGFTPSGNRRYIPNTLENVSKIMKKQGRNGATGAWASFPNFAARLMPSYGTLEDIRSKKGLLTSDREKIDDFREKWSKVFFELGMKCQPDATGTFDDYGFDRLSEAAMTSDPQAFLKQEYNVDFSDEDTKRLKKMVKAIKEEYPAMYFETKFERPVYLNEFAAVVVPNDLGADVKKALSDLGIAMYEYDASKEGDRSRAFDEAVKSSGKIRFQFIGEKGAAEADHAEEVFANENVERSVREGRSEKTDLTAEERELRDNLVERMRKGGLDVVTDSEEMQRVIDTENERTRNMFVGEKGATEADKAEEVSTRLDNLSVARRMEEAKKDAKTIKMATGWERGSDGKWRYETSDIKPKPFEEWMDKKNLKLGDIIDSDSGLFEMYPKLKDFKVTRGKGKSTNAAIYTGLGKIEINFSKFKPYMSIPSNREKIDGILHRVINHEIQHAIQDSEGFAQGVSPNAFSPDAPIGKLREMEEADGRMVERYNAMSYTEKALGEGVRLKERILENRKEYNALASKYRFGMDGYTRAAGEVEARNTEKRIGMTEEERRASLASETEDVAREDQILLRQGLDGINIMRSEAAATPLKGDEALTALDSIFGENEGSAIPPKISSFAKFKNLFKKPVRTFLGELVQVKDEVWNKILRNNRQDITGTVLPTIENADFAIRDTDGSTLYVKRFKGNGQERMYNVVVVNKHGEVEDYISSVHIKRDNNLRNKIKKGAELFLPNARTTDGTMSRNNSTPGAKVANYSETAKPRYSRKPGESIFDYASRVSEDVDRSVRERVSARDEYEKKVKSKGFQTKEALQNSMLGLQEFMYAIDHASGNKRYIEDIPDFENPILGENRLSSVNKEEMHQVAKTQFKPLMSAVAKLSGNGKESGELYDYMFAKHGLERDAVMRQREAKKEFDKYQKANPKGTKTIGDFVASLEGKDYAGLTALTAEDGRVKSIQSQIDAIDEQMKATDDQLLLRKLGGQKKRLKVDLLNAARDAADDIRKAFESNPSHDRSDINELWKRVNEVNGNTLRKLYESGMLTKEAYNDISSMYTNYIPMRGFDQTTSADAYAYLTHGDSAFNAPIKTAKGRSSKADNPIAYMQAMAESAIMQGNRNVLVKQKMLNFVRNHPSDLASVSDVWLQYDSVADEWKPFYAFGRESKGETTRTWRHIR